MSDAVTAAEAQAVIARARLGATLSTLQSRLAPKALAQEAAQGLLDKGQAVATSGVEVVRRNPLTVAGALGAVALFLARKPIAKLLTKNGDATSPTPDSLTLRKPRAVKRKPK
ncbi:DUF3618 domain-containing protein [Sphingomonas sp. PB4P5]|uniref:DUF3618 domain-containing protein n=1 Tax=Parasphingomonas puruogangriensis TaxID=3096155 RepID=UPI002FC98DBD